MSTFCDWIRKNVVGLVLAAILAATIVPQGVSAAAPNCWRVAKNTTFERVVGKFYVTVRYVISLQTNSVQAFQAATSGTEPESIAAWQCSTEVDADNQAIETARTLMSANQPVIAGSVHNGPFNLSRITDIPVNQDPKPATIPAPQDGY